MRSSKQHRRTLDRVAALVGACAFPNDFHYSDEWGNRLVAAWINLKRAQVVGRWSPERFREALIDSIIDLDGNWEAAFETEAGEEGIALHRYPEQARAEMLRLYLAKHRSRALDLVPKSLHAEFCWIPGWDGVSLDALLDEFGVESRSRSTYREDVVPGRWLRELLHLGNLSHESLLGALDTERPENQAFVDACRDAKLSYRADPARAPILRPEDVITIVENSYVNAVPVFHCMINVRALFEFECDRPMVLTSAEGKVHLGMHEGVLNGAGFMDSYRGSVTIPSNATGFIGAARWRWAVAETYGLVRRHFRMTPQPPQCDHRAAA